MVAPLVASCVFVAAGFAGAFTVAASQLRQRKTDASIDGVERTGDGEGDRLVDSGAAGTASATKTRPDDSIRRAITLVVLFALSIAAGVTAFVLFWTQDPGGTAPGPGRCARAPSVQARLKHAAGLRFTHPINTRFKRAQRLFDLGLVEAWNFNQHEAHGAFAAAAAEDPSCSRCWWGVAYALGPGANRAVVADPQPFPSWSPQDFPATRAAAHQANRLAEEALKRQPNFELAQRDAAWGAAINARFREGSARQPVRDEAELEYAQQIAAIGDKWQDADAYAIAAETYMNLSPWDYYEGNAASANHTLKPNAVAAEALVNKALSLKPDHPLAAHLLIHVAEASSPVRGADVSAARAEEIAGRLLARKGPATTMGHLLHMPSHTYVRIGRWHDAVLSNIRAYQADVEDVKACRIPYVPEHNTDMLVYAAIQGGEKAAAVRWARKLRQHQDGLHTAAYGDSSREWTHLALVQAAFADWRAILAAPEPPLTARDNCPSPGAYEMAKSVWHYTRGLALAALAAAKSDPKQAVLAAEELAKFQETAAKVPEEGTTLPGEWPGIYACDRAKLLGIYGGTLRATLLALKGNLTEAEEHLKAAAATEDSMGYMEPPRLYLPVRHCLGALLIGVGRAKEAEEAFRQDLAVHPDNGRSLSGLSLALEAQGRKEEADAIRAGPLKAAWRHADSPATPCRVLLG